MSLRIYDSKQPYVAMGAYVDHSALLVGDVMVTAGAVVSGV
jgi:carbonic anhydrase/acetyltransferase-like protein (isoleucine patch superfamily)